MLDIWQVCEYASYYSGNLSAGIYGYCPANFQHGIKWYLPSTFNMVLITENELVAFCESPQILERNLNGKLFCNRGLLLHTNASTIVSMWSPWAGKAVPDK